MKQPRRNLVLRSGSSAFTLMEVLVAVAALALLAVGVAAIFDTTGKTVQAGRRVSTFSSYAALIEQQLRQDIESMTREGILVIRNQYAADDPIAIAYNVPLHAEDLSGGRPRRIDEIMFFAKGEFRSARELLAPGLVAQSDSARIYYGHGTRRQRNVDPNEPYLFPEVYYRYEGNPPQFEDASVLGYNIPPDSPNRFASDWTLLRHVTLLRQPRTTSLSTISYPLGISQLDAIDSDIQIALQPAASQIFRSLSGLFPVTPPAALRNGRPAFVSGLVDIATTDFSEIRQIIETADTWPNTADEDFFDPQQNDGDDGDNAGVDGLRRRWGTGTGNAIDPLIVQRMHAWMNDTFPGNSMGHRQDSQNRLTRMRYEPSPNNFVGIAADNPSIYNLNDLQRAYRRADQLMLSSSNFLPRCTEFIVEWSAGLTIPSDLLPAHPNYQRRGEVIWYGMERQVNGQLVAAPYSDAHIFPDPQVTAAWEQPITVQYTRVDGTVRNRMVPPFAAPGVIVPHLIHNEPDVTGSDQQAVASYFGWTDPTFDPENPEGGSATGNGLLDLSSESASPTIEWPWPKMIRITMSLADPRDPSIEQTFQFVFDVPAGRSGR